MQSIEHIRHISAQELAVLGMQDMAYVKQVMVDGVCGCAIHAADGTQVALVADRDLAFAIVRQNELEPVSVH
jgi:hypothetical protein